MELNSSTSNQSVASTSPPLIQGSTSSSRSLDQFDVEDAIAAQANSLYFTLFPAEIRRKILIEAFGDRVLHIVHSKDPRTGQLQWSGGECQNPPLYYPGPDRYYLGKQMCDCFESTSILWHKRHHKKGIKIKVIQTGALGWIKSCRIAFAEGTMVLYGNNTINICTETMRLNISHYIPTQQFSKITSIQWFLEESGFCIMGKGDIQGANQLGLLEHLVHAIPTEMPNLRKFYFGFSERLSFWDEPASHFKRRFQLYTRDILPIMDRMVSKLFPHRCIDMEIGVPLGVFTPHFEIGKRTGVRFQSPSKGHLTYATKQARVETHQRSRVWHPIATVEEEGLYGTNADCGYWISATDGDLPLRYPYDSRYYHLRFDKNSVDDVKRAWWNSACDEPNENDEIFNTYRCF